MLESGLLNSEIQLQYCIYQANRFDACDAWPSQLAQQLYEGVKLGTGELTGLITYMRTDGVQVHIIYLQVTH